MLALRDRRGSAVVLSAACGLEGWSSVSAGGDPMVSPACAPASERSAWCEESGVLWGNDPSCSPVIKRLCGGA